MRGYDVRLRKNRLTEGKISNSPFFLHHNFLEIGYDFPDFTSNLLKRLDESFVEKGGAFHARFGFSLGTLSFPFNMPTLFLFLAGLPFVAVTFLVFYRNVLI